MIQVCIAFLIFFILFLFRQKEGFGEEDMTLIIDSLVNARKDKRMRPDQIMAIENALRYALFIKNL
jgi:hypothetical protein